MMAFWVSLNFDIRILGFDKDGPRSNDGTAKLGSEPVVPTAPQC
jgi:hypothetical protein